MVLKFDIASESWSVDSDTVFPSGMITGFSSPTFDLGNGVERMIMMGFSKILKREIITPLVMAFLFQRMVAGRPKRILYSSIMIRAQVNQEKDVYFEPNTF